MALVPSSSLWSSIKIPFCLYGNRKIAPTIPYVVDSCKDLKQKNYNKEAKPARKMVSLKVPTPSGKTEENPPPLSITLKKRTRRKSKTKQIGYVMVPGGDSSNGSNDWEKICSSSSSSSSFEKAILNPERWTSPRSGEDLNRKWSDFDWERVSGECGCIPSVKPWVQEQDRKHRKTRKVGEDKKCMNNEKEKIIINCKDNTSGSSNSKGLKTFQSPHDKHSKKLQKPTGKVKEAATYANYYERKLAELYSIELGLKI